MDLRGKGTYGAVYRARDFTGMNTVALKLALHSRDERFAREAELLSRIRHPAVPRLRASGQWQPAKGPPHPYLAMDWVEGTPLYDWASEHRPTSRQVMALLARLARALEATHAVGGLHRDVKGHNVVVREADGQAFLMDFGSSHFVGAATQTCSPFPPGTPAYRSPEAWRFAAGASASPYAPGQADDVFALGVTAFRMITGRYPPSTHPDVAESRCWHTEGARAPSPRDVNGRCGPELSALVSRMLSPGFHARGSARELAEALESAVARAGAKSDVPLLVGGAPRARASAQWNERSFRYRVRRLRWPWVAIIGLGGPLVLSLGWRPRAGASVEVGPLPTAMSVEATDGGTVAVGDSVFAAPASPVQAPVAWSTIGLEMPPRPFPGQTRPDASGRCPRKLQVPINGGCWVKLAVDNLKDCDEDGYVHKGACYGPAFPPMRPATSSPTRH
ncbi:serine/threonine protein kinase [Myxococcus sp. AM009]|uniref:serine/threonine-protein kinase n=1 Tax=unclassified Myxococcus TaxID=2648731 RepID=UPI001595CA5C|nr:MULTISPECIES: serine/threonine-protein kinase [unclassified Myxococcus]NVI98260.1 serine/threonine protein kinase [Myxococcus sp. AM009]NVJ14879.1 serine/threonine protein kinase [Myxococcus sp. AM010]